MGEKENLSTKIEQLGIDFLVGGTIGGITKTIVAPIERVKLLMQTQNSNPEVISGKILPYKTNWDCAKGVLRTQGFLAFWNGNLVNCLRYGPQQGSALAFNSQINKLFPKYDIKTDFWKGFLSKLLSGGIAGALANTFCYPLDYARTRLATDLAKPKFKGIIDCIGTTVREQGIVGLYRGWVVTTLGAFVYRAGQLGLFQQIQDINPYKNDKGSIGAVSAFIAVTIARTCILPFNYPFDTIRRRVMLESETPVAQRNFKGSWDCFLKVRKNEGIVGFYKGFPMEIVRGIGGSLVVVGYNWIHVYFDMK